MAWLTTAEVAWASGHGAVALFIDNVDGALSVLNNAGHRVITESDLQDDDEYL